MKNILSAIGNTPLIEIKKINLSQKVHPVKCHSAAISPKAKLFNGVKIFAKLEGFNPTGSIKDRIVLEMVEKAEKNKILKKGKTIIEPTSGNTGISMAMIGAVKGYKVKIIMPKSMSVMKRKMIENFGAKIILVKDNDWRDNAIKFTKKLAEKNNFVMLNQYENEANIKSHYKTTGKEILKQVQGKIDYFIAGLGTGGTITGIGKRLKEKFQNIKIIGVQPKLNSNIEGLKSLKEGYTPPILDVKIIDEIIEVNGKNALLWQKKLAKEEGIFAGVSSGAAMFVSQNIARKIKKGNIITIFPDRGEKYL